MPRNGTGTYDLVNNTWYPPVNGVLAQSTDWQTFIEDMASALTQSVSKDGQTPMTGNLPMGNNKITGLATGTANTDAVTVGQLYPLMGQTGPIVFRNRVRNGAFNINQRGVTGSVVLAAGVYGHDGWKAGSGGCTYTYSTSGITTTITISAGTLVQVIEGANVEGGVYCMTWTGTSTGKIGGGAFSASGVNSTSQTAGVNLSIEFTTGTLTNVQVEPGTTGTPFERRPISYELSFCRRYFHAISGAVIFGMGQATGTTSVTLVVAFPVQMRAAPTLVASSITALTATGTPIVANTAAIGTAGVDSVSVNLGMASASFVAGDASIVLANLGTAGLQFAAEL